MTLHQLRVFVAVAEARSVSKASSSLRISQPAITRHMRTLEEEYGVKLYHAPRHGIELTQHGKLFLRYAKRVMAEVKEIETEFGQKPLEPSLSLTIGASYTASAAVLPLIIRKLKETDPELDLTVCTDNSPRLLRLVGDSVLDVALSLTAVSHPSLTYEPLWRDTPIMVARENHPLLKKRERQTLRDLRELPLIVNKNRVPGGFTDRAMNVLEEEEKWKVRVVMECSSTEALRTAVRSGLGLGLFFHDFIAPDLASGRLRAVDVPALKQIVVPFYAVYSHDKPLSPVVKTFMQIVRNIAPEYRVGD